MVATRRSRRRSRSDLASNDEAPSDVVATTTPPSPSSPSTKTPPQKTLQEQKEDNHTFDEDKVKDGTSTAEKEAQKRLVADKTTDVSPSKKSTETKKKRNEKKKKQSGGNKNPLSKLLPGYTAPMQLTSSALDALRPKGGLETLRRQAIRSNPHPSVTTKRPVHDDSANDGWFGMRATPMTKEVQRDLALIRNRNYLDPKRFYKKTSSDKPGARGVVQIGTVIEGPTEYYSARLTKQQRRTNLVDEILADPTVSTYASQKYKRMQQDKTAASQKRHKRQRRGKR